MMPLAKLLPTLLLGPILLYAVDPPAFNAGVTLVHVDAQVTYRHGGLVTGLSQSDFRVYDQGKEQPLAAFAAEDQPVDLVLLIDVSGSMYNAVERLAGATGRALRELRKGDRVAVMTFDSETRLAAQFTDDLASVEDTIQQLLRERFSGSTRIHDALYDAAALLRELGDRPGRRHAILILTDNFGGGKRSAQSAVENLWEADATLCGIVTEVMPPELRLPFTKKKVTPRISLVKMKKIKMNGGIRRPVAMTGGEMMQEGAVDFVLPEMMRRIRSRYSLYYRMPDGELGAIRKVRVELTEAAKRRNPSAIVLARQGYRTRVRDQDGFVGRP